MSLETTRDLSIQDLLRVLNEKLSLECARLYGTTPLPPLVSSTSLESEIKNLEARARDVLRFLSRLRNMLQPVNRLPPEIIPLIARHILLGNTSGTYPLIPLTHVCQYWRESIISAPENWTLISSNRMGLIALTLERSKAVPLQVRLLNHPPVGRKKFRDLMASHIQNIGILRFKGLINIEDLTKALPNFPQSTPNLRSLELARVEAIIRSGPPIDPSIDPFGLFPNTLRSLTLYDIHICPSFLKLGTLTDLSLRYHMVKPPLDTLLDVLEENCSLESVDLIIDSEKYPTKISQRRTVVLNQLRHLSITCRDTRIGRTLISSIPLRRGVHLEITLHSNDAGLGLNSILTDISMTHLSNLTSSTFMTYRSYPREIQLIGPNGGFSYIQKYPMVPLPEFSETPSMEFPVLPLTNVKELRLMDSDPFVMAPQSFFPALETLIFKCDTGSSHLFLTSFPDPSLFPSLKTLRFLECAVAEELMEELTRFASNRKTTTPAWLHRVVIVHRDANFPTAASIRELEKHVPIVDVRTLSMDLT